MILENLVIRPNLVPFLYEEMEGKQAKYQQQEVLFVQLAISSSLVKFISNKLESKKSSLIMYLKVHKKKHNTYSGEIYEKTSKGIEPLLVPKNIVIDFNNLLEDMFRISLVFYINGAVEFGFSVCKAIDKYIEKYNLLEVGYDSEAIRQMYYRNQKKLKRVQHQSSNRTYNHVTQ